MKKQFFEDYNPGFIILSIYAHLTEEQLEKEFELLLEQINGRK